MVRRSAACSNNCSCHPDILIDIVRSSQVQWRHDVMRINIKILSPRLMCQHRKASLRQGRGGNPRVLQNQVFTAVGSQPELRPRSSCGWALGGEPWRSSSTCEHSESHSMSFQTLREQLDTANGWFAYWEIWEMRFLLRNRDNNG